MMTFSVNSNFVDKIAEVVEILQTSKSDWAKANQSELILSVVDGNKAPVNAEAFAKVREHGNKINKMKVEVNIVTASEQALFSFGVAEGSGKLTETSKYVNTVAIDVHHSISGLVNEWDKFCAKAVVSHGINVTKLLTRATEDTLIHSDVYNDNPLYDSNTKANRKWDKSITARDSRLHATYKVEQVNMQERFIAAIKYHNAHDLITSIASNDQLKALCLDTTRLVAI